MLTRAAALALAVLLVAPVARAAEEDVPRAAVVQRATILLPSGKTAQVQDGFWLSRDAAYARARELERLRAENASLKADAGKVPAKAIALAVLAGTALGFTLARVAR